MQCKLEPRLPEGDDWEYEAEFDGYRALVLKTREQVSLLSRRNNALTNDFPKSWQAEGLEDIRL